MRSPLVHPKLRGNLANVYPSKCTIQSVVYGVSNANQKVPIGSTDIPGLIDLVCGSASFVEASVSDDQTRNANLESGFQRRECKLIGYFPQILYDGTMVAKVDGVTFNIRGVEADSQHFSTRLRLESMRP